MTRPASYRWPERGTLSVAPNMPQLLRAYCPASGCEAIWTAELLSTVRVVTTTCPACDVTIVVAYEPRDARRKRQRRRR